MSDSLAKGSKACVADVGFVVDISGSVQKYYSNELTFVKDLAKDLEVSTNGAHVSVVQFCNETHTKLEIEFILLIVCNHR